MAENSLTLSFHFLNVGHGSSVIVELTAEDKKYFGLVDSNHSGQGQPRALQELIALGCEHLSFLCITHPHRDHFSGISHILEYYRGRIDRFFSFPMGDLIANKTRFKKWGQNLHRLRKSTPEGPEREAILEFLKLLIWADSLGSRWDECAGDNLQWAPPDFSPVKVFSIQPPKASKGNYIQRIDNDSPFTINNFNDNDISLAISFEYGGTKILLGGDAPRKNWISRRRFEAGTKQNVDASVVNLPHHGSPLDNDDDVIKQLFSPLGDRFAITSANGISHPSVEVVRAVETFGAHPYCTNLMAECGANLLRISPPGDLEPELSRLLTELGTSRVVQPCQGDIRVTVSETGLIDVRPQFANYCGFRRP